MMDQLLPGGDVAKILLGSDAKRSQLDNLLKAGVGPEFIQIGARRMFEAAALKRFIEENRHQPGEPRRREASGH